MHRQLHLGQQRRGVDAVQFDVQRVGEVHHRAGPQHRGLHRLLVDALAVIQQRKLLLLRRFRTQLAAQVAQRQVVEGEAALTGPDQIGRQRGVGADAVERPAPPGEVVDRQLGLVQGFRLLGVGQPVGQRRVVLGCQRCGVDVAAVAVGGGDRQRCRVAAVGQMRPDHCQTCPTTVGDVVGQPLRDRAGLQRFPTHVEALVDLRLDSGQRVEQPVAQHPEFQLVEQLVDLVAVPGLHPQRVRRLRQRHVAHQVGELAVEHHAGQIRPQCITDLAAHRFDVVDERLQ